MNDEIHTLALSLEDDQDFAEELCEAIRDMDLDVQAEPIDYLSPQGAPKDVTVVARDACAKVYSNEGRTAFLVDRSPNREASSSYGLDVIDALQQELVPDGMVADLLKHPSFLVVLVSVFGLSQADINARWPNSDVQIKHLRQDADVANFLAERQETPILAVIDKAVRRSLVIQLLKEWS